MSCTLSSYNNRYTPILASENLGKIKDSEHSSEIVSVEL